jgi:hypothetical protein
MTDSSRLPRTRQIEQAERAERLARALRENLRRRKAQARAKEAASENDPAAPRPDEPSA